MPKFMSYVCGQAVDGLRTDLRTTSRLIRTRVFCTHFVRSLWVKCMSFTNFVRNTCAQVLLLNQSVNADLYPFSTELTNTPTFSNLNKFLIIRTG